MFSVCLFRVMATSVCHPGRKWAPLNTKPVLAMHSQERQHYQLARSNGLPITPLAHVHSSFLAQPDPTTAWHGPLTGQLAGGGGGSPPPTPPAGLVGLCSGPCLHPPRPSPSSAHLLPCGACLKTLYSCCCLDFTHMTDKNKKHDTMVISFSHD